MIAKTPNTVTTIQAEDLHAGHLMVDQRAPQPMRVLRVMTCADGSLRVMHAFGECRMTGSIRVRVLH